MADKKLVLYEFERQSYGKDRYLFSKKALDGRHYLTGFGGLDRLTLSYRCSLSITFNYLVETVYTCWKSEDRVVCVNYCRALMILADICTFLILRNA